MLPRRGTISSFAHDVIADGNDLHITGSFEEDEENSSTVANASCHTRSVAVGISDGADMTKNRSVKKTTNIRDHDAQDMEGGGVRAFKKPLKVMKLLRQLGQKHKLLPLKFRKQASVYRSSMNTVAEYQEIVEDEHEHGNEEGETHADDSNTIVSQRSSRNNIRTGRSMLVRQNAQVISRPSAAQAKWDIAKSHSFDSRSYRNLMLRQKSLILDDSSCGGMSDITDDTGFYGFSKTDNLLIGHRPMYMNGNTYCIEEDEDESDSDSDSDNDSEENDSSSASEEIERAYDFRELSPLNDDAESIVSPLNNDGESREDNDLNSCWHLDNEKEETQSPVDDNMRKRVFSDSDIVFERQRQVSKDSPVNNLLAPSSNFPKREQFQDTFDQRKCRSHRRSSSSPCRNSESFDRSFEVWAPQNSSTPSSRLTAEYDSWPKSRTRTHSDSYLHQTPVNDAFRSPVWENLNEMMSVQNGNLLDTEAGPSTSSSKKYNILSFDAGLKTPASRRPSLPLFGADKHDFPYSRSRTHSDSIVHEKSGQEHLEINWDPRHNSLLDVEVNASSTKCTEGSFGTFELDGSPMASHARRLTTTLLSNKRQSPSTKTVDEDTIHPRPVTSSVLATLSPTTNRVGGDLTSPRTETNRMPLQHFSIRNPSPSRTLNAASMMAAALRPAPAQTLPTLPTQSPSAGGQQSEKYYWGSQDVVCSDSVDERNQENGEQEIELKNLCSWSSEESII